MVHEFNDEQLELLHQINKARKTMIKAGADPSCVWMNRKTYEFLAGEPPQIILDSDGKQITNGQVHGLNIFVNDEIYCRKGWCVMGDNGFYRPTEPFQ